MCIRDSPNLAEVPEQDGNDPMGQCSQTKYLQYIHQNGDVLSLCLLYTSIKKESNLPCGGKAMPDLLVSALLAKDIRLKNSTK